MSLDGITAEIGLCLAACTHAVVLKALNMYEGEIFAYPLCLIEAVLANKTVKLMCQDVVCHFWPWLERIRDKLPDITVAKQVKPFLSTMHAKVHDWAYQVIFWPP